MWVRVLGSAAGGGSPQWNCGCEVCVNVRSGAAPPRTQSSIVVSPDRQRWFLFNASPDVLTQFASFPPLQPRSARESPVEAVFLTDAELDHTMGLLLLREAESIRLHATPAVHKTLCDGSGLLTLLERYCQVEWTPVVAGAVQSLTEGLTCSAFEVETSKRDRFGVGAGPGRVVGYRLHDANTGGTLVYLPGVQQLTPQIREQIESCTCLLIDGTCFRDDELVRLGLAAKTSRQMGHTPVEENLDLLGRRSGRTVFVHLNNTNPILLEGTPERLAVEQNRLEVAVDGLEMEV
ncbi:pyrroloquinoline quinone biosynthesis protein PqqB [Kineosporia babensis]|uniref:Coenzyme PQQ synthesis protein B n=1 Tax=Kineosporia babensis TaxID=499548 RepID=A0A9X1NA90_9ACTN|nr:pyrroloquinoline quinone biosynthesis protein PqqB [Kineosporia babensis]MCD5310400.1 pyrroloquinoline quinone biosynthesis protein PqqB [Kineosporia babensis]